MFPDLATAQYRSTATSRFDEVWTGDSDTGHDLEVYWLNRKFVVYFESGADEFTQDGNRLQTGDRLWFRQAVLR